MKLLATLLCHALALLIFLALTVFVLGDHQPDLGDRFMIVLFLLFWVYLQSLFIHICEMPKALTEFWETES